MRECDVESCNGKCHAIGFCDKHYSQFKKYGKILKRTIYTKNKIILKKDYALIELYNKKQEIINYTKIDLDDVEKCY